MARSRRRDDLAEFRRDDSVSSAPVRRQLFTWRGDEGDTFSSGTLPPPFVKSVDYVPVQDERPQVGPFVHESVPIPGWEPWGSPRVLPTRGASRSTLVSVLRPTFGGSDNPCAARARRREVIFAIGAGGRRLGTKKVRRTPDSERSC